MADELPSIDDLNAELKAPEKELPSLDDLNADLKKKSGNEEEPISTTTVEVPTNGQKKLGGGLPSLLKKSEKTKVDDHTYLPPKQEKYGWDSPKFELPKINPIGSNGQEIVPLSEQLKVQTSSFEKEQQDAQQFIQSSPLAPVTDIGEIINKPDEDVLSLSEKVFLNGPKANKGIFEQYLQKVKSQDPEGYSSISQQIFGNASDTGFDEKKRFDLVNKALSWDIQKTSKDLDIYKARGYDKIAEDYFKKKEEVNTLFSQYEPQVDEWNKLVPELQLVKDDFDKTADPSRKEMLSVKYNDLLTRYKELEPIMQEYGTKVGPKKKELDDFEKTNKEELMKWGMVVKDVHTYQENIQQNIKDHPKEYEKELQKNERNVLNKYLPTYTSVPGAPPVVIDESIREIWNTVVKAGVGLLELTKDINDPLKMLGGVTGENIDYTPSDKAFDGIRNFTENYIKFSTSDLPLVEPGSNDINWSRLLPTIARTGTDMAILLAGANKFVAPFEMLGLGAKSAETASLISSSFIQTYDDYKNLALENGYTQKDAINFSTGVSALIGILETISPNKIIRGTTAEKDALVNILKGVKNPTDAIKEFYNLVLKEGGKEVAQELTQGYAEKIAGYFSNAINPEDTKGRLPDTMTYNEVLETTIATLATTVLFSGGVGYANKTAVRNSALQIAADNYDKFFSVVNNQIKDGTIDPLIGKNLIEEVRGAVLTFSKMPSTLSDEQKQNIFPFVKKRVMLEEELKTTSDAFKPMIEEQIKNVDAQIQKELGVKIGEEESETKKTEKSPELTITTNPQNLLESGEYEPNFTINTIDANKRWSNGEELFAQSEQDEEIVPITSLEMLNSYTPDQIFSLKKKEANDNKDTNGLPGEERVRQEPVQKDINEETGSEKTPPGGMVQAPPEKIIPITQETKIFRYEDLDTEGKEYVAERLKEVKKAMGKDYSPQMESVYKNALAKEWIGPEKGTPLSEKKVQSFISFAPMRSKPISFGSTKEFNDADHQRLIKTTRNLAEQLGVQIEEEEEINGGYKDSETGQRVVGPSRRIKVTGKPEDIEALAAMLGVMAPELQDTVLTHTYDENGKGAEANLVFKSHEDADVFQKELQEAGETNFSYNPQTKTMSIINLDRQTQSKAIKIIDKAIRNGKIKKYGSKRVTGRFIRNDEYGEIIQKAQLRRHDEGKPGTDSDLLYEFAQDRARRQRGDYAEKLKAERQQAARRATEYVESRREQHNLPGKVETEVSKVDDVLHKKISDAYDNLKKDNSSDPLVKQAYTWLAREVNEQFDYLTKTLGIKIEFIKEDPYLNSEAMFEDILVNKHLKIYQGGEPHPFLDQKDESGYSLNEKLRAVHDYFGHFIEGNQFGKLGEERAWVAHSKMFSPLAQRALSTETRGQNAWVNMSGRNQEALDLFKQGNALIKEGKVAEGQALVKKGQEIFQFVEQKVDLLPEELTDWTIYSNKETENTGALPKKDVTKEPSSLAEQPPSLKKEETIKEKKQESERGDGRLRDKALLNNLHKSKNISQEAKSKLEKAGLKYRQFTNDEATAIADEIIAANGIDDALVMARDNEISNAVRTMLYARALDHYYGLEQKASTEEEKQSLANKWAEISIEMDEYARDQGQGIQIISRFYQQSPLGIKTKAKKELSIERDKQLDKKRGIPGRKKSLREVIEKSKDKLTSTAPKKSRSTIFTRSHQERLDRIEALKKKWKEKGGDKLTSGGLDPEKIEIAVELGAEYMALGLTTFAKWSKRMMADLGITEDQAKKVWNNKTTKDVDDKQRTLNEISVQEFGEDIREEKLKMLAKMFPSKVFQKTPEATRRRKQQFEKILDVIEALRDENGNINNEEYEKAFYEMLGILDPDNKEINDALDVFSKRIAESEPGLFRDKATREILSWIANQKRDAFAKSIFNIGLPVYYANILYGYETHLRNFQWNLQSSMLFSMGMLSAKNPKYAGQIWKSFFQGLKRGGVEARDIFRTGDEKTGSPITEKEMFERVEKTGFLKWLATYYTLPFRALRASDALFSFALNEAKLKSLMLNDAIGRNGELPEEKRMTRSEVEATVNDLMGDTSERLVQAQESADKETQTFYKLDEPLFIDGKKNTKYQDVKYNEAYRNYKKRVYQLMEESRPDSLKEIAQDWTERALLMGQPKGYLGALATALNTLFSFMPAAKLITMPFVNVPLNVAGFMIEWSPLGFFTVLAGKEGYGIPEKLAKRHRISQEMTEDQKKEMVIKATVSTVAMGIIYGLTQMRYHDDDEGDRPVLIVYADGTGDYAKNKELQQTEKGHGFEYYTLDFMGHRMSYKSSPLVAWFSSIGYMGDYDRYRSGSETSMFKKIAMATYGHLTFMTEQANLSGLKDLVNLGDQVGSFADDESRLSKMVINIEKGSFKFLKNLVVPNYISQANNDIRGLMDLNDKRAINPWEYLIKDVPVVDQMLTNRLDHFGRPVKDEFDIPFYPKGPKEVDKYYDLVQKQGYLNKLKFYNDKTIFINDTEIEVTREQVQRINQIRGQYVIGALSDPEKHKKLGGVTTYDFLAGLTKEDFDKTFASLFSEATWYAKDKVFGQGLWQEEQDIVEEQADNKKEIHEFKKMYQYTLGHEQRKKDKKKKKH